MEPANFHNGFAGGENAASAWRSSYRRCYVEISRSRLVPTPYTLHVYRTLNKRCSKIRTLDTPMPCRNAASISSFLTYLQSLVAFSYGIRYVGYVLHWSEARYSSNANGIQTAHDFQFAELVVGWFKVVPSRPTVCVWIHYEYFVQLSSFIPSAEAVTTNLATTNIDGNTAIRLPQRPFRKCNATSHKIKYAVYFNFDLVWSYKVFVCDVDSLIFFFLREKMEETKKKNYQHSKQ